MPKPPVQIMAPGLTTLRRDMGRISKELKLALDGELREAGNKVRDRSRVLLRERSKNPRGRIERTIRTSVASRGVSIYSRHPGAAVQQWGGTIKPRGTPITIEAKRFMSEAVGEALEEVEREMGDLFDRVVQRYQFRQDLLAERRAFAEFFDEASQ